MFRTLGRFLLFLVGIEPAAPVYRPQVKAESTAPEPQVQTSGYVPTTVGEVLTEACRIVREENIGVQVKWTGGVPAIRRMADVRDPVIVTVDIREFPNAVKAGWIPAPKSVTPRNQPKKEAVTPDHLFGEKGRLDGSPITLEMLDEAAEQCNISMRYLVFEDPATMKRAAEPEAVRKLYSLSRD